MDALRKEESYTINDIYALPDGERAELIDGKIYYMAPRNTKHQRLVHFLTEKLEIIFKVAMVNVKCFRLRLLYF